MTPRPDQERSIEHLLSVLKSERAAIDGSDTGVGKTLVAVETIKRWDEPTVIVCPKAVIPGWKRTGAAQGVSFDVLNYEMLRTGRTPYGEWKVPPGMRKEKFVWHKGIKRLVFDEAQRCQGRTSLNSELMRAARRQNIATLALSATFAEDPLDMDALGYILKLHDGDNDPTLRNPDPVSFFQWSRTLGCKPGFRGDFEFGGSDVEKRAVMAALNKQLYPAKGVRVRRTEVPNFPDSQITAELYDLEQPGRIDELYNQMAVALADLKKRIADNGVIKESHPLTCILRARQEVELLKVPVFVELAQEAISSGMSVAIFVNFSATLEEICRRLGTDCFINGSQTGVAGAIRREANRLRFQSDQSRVLVCNNEAGGVGLDAHDVTGKHPRLALISAGYNAKVLRQVLGRVWRAGALSKSLQRIIFAAGTQEELIHGSVSGKLDNLDALNDGDLEPGNLKVTFRF